MTKLLVCIIIILACAEQVRAEGRSVKEQAPVPYGALVAPSPPTYYLCIDKMQEAMKLILPYIDYGDTISSTDAVYRTPQTRLREEADRMDRRDAALRRWNAIYEECVK